MRHAAPLVLALTLAACGDPTPRQAEPDAGDEPACEYPVYDHGTDGLYEGYVACSSARFPDFTHPTTRWDGTYPAGCAGTTGVDAFACFEQRFWQVMQFDYDDRAVAYEELVTLVEAVGDDPALDTEQRARLHWRLGQLAAAMASENADLSGAPQMRAHLEAAVEILPENVILVSWLKTVDIMTAVQLGGDYEVHLQEMWELYELDPPGVAGTLLGIAAGLPMDSGWPAIAIELVEGIDQDACAPWCGWEFRRAPHALEGQYFLYAETYARVGDATNTQIWLERVASLPEVDTWPFKPELDAALADLDAFLLPFADAPADSTVFDRMLMNTTGTCRACHDHEY